MQSPFRHWKIWIQNKLQRSDVLLLTFIKWTDESRRKLYHDDVNYLLNASHRDAERQQDPDFIDWPKGVVWMDVKQVSGFQKMTKEDIASWKKSKKGTPPGSTITITFTHAETAASRKAEVISYLRRVGVEVV